MTGDDQFILMSLSCKCHWCSKHFVDVTSVWLSSSLEIVVLKCSFLDWFAVFLAHVLESTTLKSVIIVL